MYCRLFFVSMQNKACFFIWAKLSFLLLIFSAECCQENHLAEVSEFLTQKNSYEWFNLADESKQVFIKNRLSHVLNTAIKKVE